MPSARHLIRAQREVIDDEFYTRRADVDDEMPRYDLAGKAVHCNCDDPRRSEFVSHFIDNFHRIGLRRLIATHWSDPQRDLLRPPNPPPVMLDWDGTGEPEIREAPGDGSFDSPESRRLSAESDVIVTNPPFSIISPIILQALNQGKDLIMIAPNHAVAYRDIWPHIHSGRLGYHTAGDLDRGSRAMTFRRPDGTEKDVAGRWLTTLPRRGSRRVLPPPTVSYSPVRHPEYDNFRIIHIPTCAEIPADWDGPMAVPITYLDKPDHDRYEMIGIMASHENRGTESLRKLCGIRINYPVLNGEQKFTRIVIRRRDPL